MDLLPGEKPPTGQDRPYSIPIVWKEWPARFNVARPYATPQDELIENIYYPSLNELWNRWEGLPEQPTIMDIYGSPQIAAARQRRQQERMKLLDLSYMDDPDYIKHCNQLDIFALDQLIEQLLQRYNQEYEIEYKQEGNPVEGYRFVEKQVPHSTYKKSRLALTIRALMQQRAAFQGRAGEVSETQLTAKGTLANMIDAKLEQAGYRDRDGYSYSELTQRARQAGALPAPAGVATGVGNGVGNGVEPGGVIFEAELSPAESLD